jgi:hypothetical protein
MAKIARPSEKAKPWWNMKIKTALKTSCTWKTKAKQEITDNNYIFPERLNTLNIVERTLKNHIKTEKRIWLQKTLEEAHTDEIWSFRKWSKGTHNYPTPPISRGPDRSKAIYGKEKQTHFAKNYFNLHQNSWRLQHQT